MTLLPAEPALLDHIVVEFGDYGRRAVEFLRTAEELLSLDLDESQEYFFQKQGYCQPPRFGSPPTFPNCTNIINRLGGNCRTTPGRSPSQ